MDAVTRITRALLIFARRPYPGRVKTRLVPVLSPEEAAGLYDCMVRDVLAKTAGLEGVDRILCYEGGADAERFFEGVKGDFALMPQQGDDLGERLTNAFATLFRRGFAAVAVIGTDSPDLPLSFIEDAFACVEPGAADIAFGPTEDGGYYLVAMREPHPELFREVPWSTPLVLGISLRRAAEEGLRAALLPVWHDVDLPADLARPELRDEANGAPLTRSCFARFGSRFMPG